MLLIACAAPQHGPARTPRPAGARPLALAAVAQVQTQDLELAFGTYRGRGATWVAGQRIAVNRDFDFGIGLGIAGLGPALAARARLDGNHALAQQLRAMPAASILDARLQATAALVAACGAGTAAEFQVYGLLFGAPRARLQVIVEVRRQRESTVRLDQVSAERALWGDASWTAHDGALLAAALVDGAVKLLQRWSHGGRRALHQQPKTL